MQDIPFDLRPGEPAFVVVRGDAGEGRPLSVLVDTGAATPFDLLVAPQAAARSGGRVGAVIPTASTVIGGARVAFRSYRMPQFRLGTAQLRDVRAGVSDAVAAFAAKAGRPIDVILGPRFLSTRTVSIDYAHRRANFAATMPTGAGTPFTLAPAYPLALVRVRLNGTGPYLMVLDTGASTSVVDPQVAAAAGMRGGGTIPVAGAGGVAGTARAVRTRISFAGRTASSSIAVADLIAPLRQSSGAPIDGILGADWFAGTRLTLDGPGKRAWVEIPRAR